MTGVIRRIRKRTGLFRRALLGLTFLLGIAAPFASSQAGTVPCVSNKAAVVRVRLSTKLALTYVSSPVLPRWSPSRPVKSSYPIVAFLRIDDCGGVTVKGVRTPHPAYKPVAKDVESAVTKAILQWKFRPYKHQGSRMPFEFALPFTVSKRGIELDSRVKVDTQPMPR